MQNARDIYLCRRKRVTLTSSVLSLRSACYRNLLGISFGYNICSAFWYQRQESYLSSKLHISRCI